MVKIFKSWLNLVITFHNLSMTLIVQASLYLFFSVGHMGIWHFTEREVDLLVTDLFLCYRTEIIHGDLRFRLPL